MARHLSDIKFEGTNEEFVWRSPITDFETGSKVTVYESQEALFYFNGECVGVLGAGSHILETEHIPFLKRLIQKITGNETIFHAQVYFVNKVEVDIKWGAGDIIYQDPRGPVFNIGCFGQLNLAAINSRKIVEKLSGVNVSLTRSQVAAKFKELVIAQVSDRLVNTILEQNISITHISAKRIAVSEVLKQILAELYDGYGFSVEQFVISGFNIPEDDPEYRRLKRLLADQGLQFSELQLEQQRELMRMQIETEKMKMQADAMAYKRSVEGYDYTTEKRFEFLGKMAEHDNAGTSISAEMLQLGAGIGMVGAVGGAMQEAMAVNANMMGASVYGAGAPQQTQMNVQFQQPVQQVAPAPAPAPAQEDPLEVLGKLKKLLDAGLIEQAEYDAKKQEVLSRL